MQANFKKSKSLLAYFREMRPGDEAFVSARDYAHTYVRVAAASASKAAGTKISIHNCGTGCEVRCYE